MNEKMIERLDAIKNRYQEIDKMMEDETLVQDIKNKGKKTGQKEKKLKVS